MRNNRGPDNPKTSSPAGAGQRSERGWVILLLLLFGGPGILLVLGISCQKETTGPAAYHTPHVSAERHPILPDSLELLAD